MSIRNTVCACVHHGCDRVCRGWPEAWVLVQQDKGLYFVVFLLLMWPLPLKQRCTSLLLYSIIDIYIRINDREFTRTNIHHARLIMYRCCLTMVQNHSKKYRNVYEGKTPTLWRDVLNHLRVVFRLPHTLLDITILLSTNSNENTARTATLR